jgi:hypothetical protein
VLREFGSRKYILRRADGQPFGDLEQVQALLASVFSGIQFRWSLSGAERLKKLAEFGPPLPQDVETLRALPSELYGVAEGLGYRVTFWLGDVSPVQFLQAHLLGESPELEKGWAALQTYAGGRFHLVKPDHID